MEGNDQLPLTQRVQMHVHMEQFQKGKVSKGLHLFCPNSYAWTSQEQYKSNKTTPTSTVNEGVIVGAVLLNWYHSQLVHT